MTKVLLTNECMGEYEGLKEVSKEEGEKKYWDRYESRNRETEEMQDNESVIGETR